MPGFRQAPPIDPATLMQKKTKGITTRKATTANKGILQGHIFGEELFATNRKIEKEIVIKFHPFTTNNLRISTDGNYIIESPLGLKEGIWNFYYCKDPIIDFFPEKKNEYHIPPLIERLPVQINHDIDLEDIKKAAIGIRRHEFFLLREKRKEELNKDDKIEQDKLDELKEKIKLEEEEKEKIREEALEKIRIEEQLELDKQQMEKDKKQQILEEELQRYERKFGNQEQPNSIPSTEAIIDNQEKNENKEVSKQKKEEKPTEILERKPLRISTGRYFENKIRNQGG